MNAMTALRKYQSVNTQAQAASADPHRLIQMLMEGGLDRIAQARGAMERQQTALKGELISKAIGIVNGLRQSLDLKQGGDIAANLDSLYDYMARRLMEANLNNDSVILEEVSGLLREVKAGWDAIAA